MTTGVQCHILELGCNCKSPFTYLQPDPDYHDFSSASLTTDDGKIIEFKKMEIKLFQENTSTSNIQLYLVIEQVLKIEAGCCCSPLHPNCAINND